MFIKNRSKSLNPKLPLMTKGSEANDGKHLSLTAAERAEILRDYPEAEKFIKRYIGSEEYINNKERYCLWLDKVDASEYSHITPIMERIKLVKEFRENNPTRTVRNKANTPMLFGSPRQPKSEFIIVPGTSSENREYIPMGFLSPDIIPNSKALTIDGADIYMFGILESNVHMDWMRLTAGRLEMRYSYYSGVYYNFPWPTPTDEQKAIIEQTAQGILDARALYPDKSLADLYNPDKMPAELKASHEANDKAVMDAYGFDYAMKEPEIVAELMKMYQELTAGEKR